MGSWICVNKVIPLPADGRLRIPLFVPHADTHYQLQSHHLCLPEQPQCLRKKCI